MIKKSFFHFSLTHTLSLIFLITGMSRKLAALELKLEGMNFAQNSSQGVLLTDILSINHPDLKAQLGPIEIDLENEHEKMMLTHDLGTMEFKLPPKLHKWLGSLDDLRVENTHFWLDSSMQFNSEKIHYNHRKVNLTLNNIEMTCPKINLPERYPLSPPGKTFQNDKETDPWLEIITPLLEGCLMLGEINVHELNFNKKEQSSAEETLLDQSLDLISEMWLSTIGEKSPVEARLKAIPVLKKISLQITDRKIAGQINYRLIRNRVAYVYGDIETNLDEKYLRFHELRFFHGKIPLTRVILTALKVLNFPLVDVNVIGREVWVRW